MENIEKHKVRESTAFHNMQIMKVYKETIEAFGERASLISKMAIYQIIADKTRYSVSKIRKVICQGEW